MNNELPEIIDPIKKKVAVLHHNDADGFGAAYAVWKALKDTCELLFIKVQYGQEPPYDALADFMPEKIFIVDFSYSADILSFMQEVYTQDLTVIDHHKTALPELQKWLPENSVNPGAGSYFFDLEMSGATLTWMMFNEDPESIPEILLYVQDRDLWRFELENSKEINAFIATMPEDFEVWDDFYMPGAYDSGEAILRFQAMQIERRLKDVVIRYLPYQTAEGTCGYNVPFVNASENISELGEAMCLAYPDAPFSVSYCDRADGKRSYSLRSRFGFDVSAVAKAFGGGGHPGAAGFALAAPDSI